MFFFATQPHKETSGWLVFVLPPWGWSTGFLATPLTLGFLPVKSLKPAFPILLNLESSCAFLPIKTKFQPDMILVCLDGSVIFNKLKSLNTSKTWQNVPLDNANFLKFLKKILDIIVNLGKNFNNVKLPGKSLNQNFWGKLEEKIFWPGNTPEI